ncbi:MAG: cupin domain-containing protein [Proteobacteria bacterium]|nr:cupin domain-containing protein [Pseudomonadota bacterium]
MSNDRAAALQARLIRNHEQVPKLREERAPLYDTLCARLAPGTAASKLGISVDILEPGKRGCPYHYHHAQEEAFVVLEGSGTLRVAGELLPITAGDVIFIPNGPDYPHQIVNTSAAPLKYLSISTRETPEVVEYPDSGKYMASARVGGGRDFIAIARSGSHVDYWDGEP